MRRFGQKRPPPNVFGIFGNSGEVCSANSRLLVQREIADDFVAKIVEHAARYSPGDPLDPASAAGPIVSGKQLDQILHYAQVECGRWNTHKWAANRIGKSGCFMEPTVVTDLSADSAVVTDEIFDRFCGNSVRLRGGGHRTGQ